MKIIDAYGRLFGRVSLIDVAAVSFLLCLAPIAYYGYGSLTGHFALSIEDIHPTTLTAGTDQRLTIMGNGFDSDSLIQLDDLPPQQARFINDARLDLEQLPPQIGPGWQSVRVTNGRKRFVIRPQGVYIVWQPEITSVFPHEILAGMPTTLTITGRYFDTGPAVTLGPLTPERVHNLSTTQLQVLVRPPHNLRGAIDLAVVNPGGGRALLPKAVEVLSPATTLRAPTLETTPPRARPRVTESCVPGQCLVAFAFPDLNSAQARQLKRGAMETEGGALRSKVVQVVHRMSSTPGRDKRAFQKKSSEQTVIAWLLLTGQVEWHSHPPVFFYRGEPLMTTGIQIPFRFGDADVMGLTLSGPQPYTPNQGR